MEPVITYVVIANTSRPRPPLRPSACRHHHPRVARHHAAGQPGVADAAADVVAQAFGEGGAGTMPRSAAAVGDAVAEGEPA